MKWFITKAADEFGVTRSTLDKAMRSIGETVEPRKQYETKLIHRALSGDLKFERTRATRAQADILQLEHAEKTGDLMDAKRGDDLVRYWLLPVREAFLALPTEMAARVNPTDPDHARQQLSDWVERAMRQVQGKITVDSVKAISTNGVNGHRKPKKIRVVRRGRTPVAAEEPETDSAGEAEAES